ncbi:MAG: pyridoxal-phosphate dependent enzyme [Acidimicrobiia bacterium]
MTAYTGRLECPRCMTSLEESEAFGGCPVCAADGVPTNVHPVYDLDSISWEPETSAPGLFRFRALLPLAPEARPVSLGEGNTPLVSLRHLGEALGLHRLYLKDETQNPTWSYKDRLAAVAVTRAVHDGAEAVVVATTGNHGAAAAAYAASAGMRCVVLTMASVPLTMKVLMQAYGARVVALRSGPERWQLMSRLVSERGWVPLSGFADPPLGSNPFGIDGYKTIAYEISEELGQVPNFIVMPTAYGDGVTGITRGFQDMKILGLVASVPRMVIAEPLGPYTASLESGSEAPARVSLRPSIAFSIASPVATFQGLHAVRSTGGTAVVVSDDEEILSGQLELARREGLYVEASAAISLPVLARLVDDQVIRPEDVVVIIGTSSGLKDVGATAAGLPVVPVIEPDLQSLDDALAGS